MKKYLLNLPTVALLSLAITSCSGIRDFSKDANAPLREVPEPAIEADGTAYNSQNIDYGKSYKVYVNPDNDPLQRINRYSYALNYRILDRYFLKPLALINNKFVPQDLSSALLNLNNTFYEVSSLNFNLLSGQVEEAGKNTARLIINSFFGLGLIDWASEMGIYTNYMDFDFALAKLGVKPGPYLMLPGVGPSYPRRLIFKAIIENMGYNYLIKYSLGAPVATLQSLLGIYYIIDLRSQLLAQEAMVASSPDGYELVKSIYLQNMNFYQSKAIGTLTPQPAEPAFDESLLDSFQ